MLKPLRIGTRDSQLALWQAHFVQHELSKIGVPSELVPVKSEGDLNLKVPLYEMGVQGIFTKALDTALLNQHIDLAVHSLKDVPTQPAEGVVITAVPERGNPYDVLVHKGVLPDPDEETTIATSSLRRAAQWLHRYPKHRTTSLRGNINSRLQKLQEHTDWAGAIFAKAGIDRIQLPVPAQITLDWMIPAPAQGALGIAIRNDDEQLREICAPLNHPETAALTGVERHFLRLLMGGCSMPVGALATVSEGIIHLDACVGSTDGKKMAFIQLTCPWDDAAQLPQRAFNAICEQGADEILKLFRHT
jgi:hydroxymethylbilane synthase